LDSRDPQEEPSLQLQMALCALVAAQERMRLRESFAAHSDPVDADDGVAHVQLARERREMMSCACCAGIFSVRVCEGAEQRE